jgi:DNA-binding response OmpR family regulator
MNGEQHGRASKVKILIVEDQMPVAMTMTFLLARAGCETEVATTGANAMQKAQDGNFDLITLDADLPGGISGYEVCRRLKENPFFQTPIVFVSGRCCIEDQQHGLDVGAADYITKPFDALDFVSRILSHVRSDDNFGLAEVIPESSMA